MSNSAAMRQMKGMAPTKGLTSSVKLPKLSGAPKAAKTVKSVKRPR